MVRTIFNTGETKPLPWRLQQLKATNSMLLDHTDDFTAALAADLGKHPSEAWLTELGFLTAEIAHTIKHLEGWLTPWKTTVSLALQPAQASSVLEPLGVILVIAPWNYPLQLLLAPMIGALAAGNTVVGKPSEMAPATWAALARWIPDYLDGAVTIIEGGVRETTELLEQRFDHIFYTGNDRVGRIIMAAAAKNLTPVTLELGGKSPVYIDSTVDMITTVRRIAWGKFMNAGQTCVAPDYVLGTDSALAKLAKELPLAIEELYGTEPAPSLAYGRIINFDAFARITGLLAKDLADDAGSALVSGGRMDAATRYIEPTVIHVDAQAHLMQSEIFGPILPLALYVFSDDAGVRRHFTEQTTSGALNFGVPAAHLFVPCLSFGAVGESWTGNYHGRHSIETFSHRKAILDKPLAPDTMALIYPPFGSLKTQVIKGLVAPAKKFRKD